MSSKSHKPSLTSSLSSPPPCSPSATTTTDIELSSASHHILAKTKRSYEDRQEELKSPHLGATTVLNILGNKEPRPAIIADELLYTDSGFGLSRKQDIKNVIDTVHAEADKGTAVNDFQYGHELKHQLNSKSKGTHPELRNKFDEHLIDVIRNTHEHLLDDVHHDIMTGIMQARAERITKEFQQLKSSRQDVASQEEKNDKKGKKREKKSQNEADLEAYATRMFAVSGIMMRDGIQDRNFVSHKYDSESLYYYELQHFIWYQTIIVLSFIILILLVLFESPASPQLLLPMTATLPVEIICLIVQCIDVIVRAKSLRHPLEEKWLVVKGICFTFCIIDWSIQFICLISDARSVGIDFRILRVFRALFFIEHFHVFRNEFTQAVETIKKILPAIFLVLTTVLFFAGLGVAMFPRKDLALALGIDTTESDLYIKDILAACIQLWYLFAGAVNFPDVMLPAFIQNDQWWYVILVIFYFITFLMVSVFVLQNILIATVIEMHRDIEIRDIIARYLRKHLAFAAAFEVIYNVQDLEETRKRLKRSIDNEKLEELDAALADTRRLAYKLRLPIAIPETVIARKLRTKLEKERDNKEREQEKVWKKERERERLMEEAKELEEKKTSTSKLEKESENHILRPESIPSNLSLHQRERTKTKSFHKKKISFKRNKLQHVATGEVDIESQRLFKSTFIRALQQLGQDVLFQNDPIEKDPKNRDSSVDVLVPNETESTWRVKPTNFRKNSLNNVLSSGMLNKRKDESGRLDEVWRSIYIAQESNEVNENRNEKKYGGIIIKEDKFVETNSDSNSGGDGDDNDETNNNLSPRTVKRIDSNSLSSTINVNSFMKLPDVLICKYGHRELIQAGESASSWKRFCVGGIRHDLRKVIASMWFSILTIVCVVVSFIIEIFVISLADVNHLVYLDAGKTNFGGFVLFNFIDISLSCFFIFEMTIRTLAVGVHGYWSNPWWKVDGIIAVCTFFIVIIRLIVVTSIIDLNGLTILMFVSCLRGIRIIKFFAIVPAIKVILVTVSKVAKKSPHFIGLLVSLYFVFSIVGMHMCNSELKISNQNLYQTGWYRQTYVPSGKNNITLLSKNDSLSNANSTIQTNDVHGYVEVVHFNNIGNAMFTLFHLTFLNNWHVTAEAVMETVMSRYDNQVAKSIAKVVTFSYFVCIFILGWVLVMNVFISKFLEGYVEAKQAKDETRKRRRLTSVVWTLNQDGEKEPKSVPINPDKQVVLDGLRRVFPTMHIKQSKDSPSVAGEDEHGTGVDDEHSDHHSHQRKGKKYCVICYKHNRLRFQIKQTKCNKIQNFLNGANVIHRCELCLSPVCGLDSCSSRVIAPMLVLEVGHVQKMKKLYGNHFHGGHIWEPLRLCTLCQDDWREELTTTKEIFREAEILHADNEQLADEVLGRVHDEEDIDIEDQLTADLLGVPKTPNGSVDIDKVRSDIGIANINESAESAAERKRQRRKSQVLVMNL